MTRIILVVLIVLSAPSCALHVSAELLNPLNKSGVEKVERPAQPVPTAYPTPSPAATPTPTPR